MSPIFTVRWPHDWASQELHKGPQVSSTCFSSLPHQSANSYDTSDPLRLTLEALGPNMTNRRRVSLVDVVMARKLRKSIEANQPRRRLTSLSEGPDRALLTLSRGPPTTDEYWGSTLLVSGAGDTDMRFEHFCYHRVLNTETANPTAGEDISKAMADRKMVRIQKAYAEILDRLAQAAATSIDTNTTIQMTGHGLRMLLQDKLGESDTGSSSK